MEEFMLLIKGDGSGSSPEQMQKKLQNYMVWMQKWKSSGNYISGNPFQTSGNLIINPETVVSNGAFLQPDEVIGGYIHIAAENLDHATEIARECPLLEGCGIYVRPFLKM